MGDQGMSLYLVMVDARFDGKRRYNKGLLLITLLHFLYVEYESHFGMGIRLCEVGILCYTVLLLLPWDHPCKLRMCENH